MAQEDTTLHDRTEGPAVALAPVALSVYKVTVKEQIQYPDRLAGRQTGGQTGWRAGRGTGRTHLESQR